MTTTPDPEVVPIPGVDPVVFWMQHKAKILIYAGLVAAALVAFAVYEYVSQARLAESQQLFAQASTENDYRQIVQKFPHTVVAGNATLLLAEKLRDQKKYDEAIATLQAMIDQYPDYPLIDAAWLSLGATLEAAGKTDEAFTKYQQTASKFPSSFSAPQALVAEGEILKGKGKLDEARQTFENVTKQFPKSFFSMEATQELQLLKK